MFGIETLGGTAGGLAYVGLVSAEALALYVGYGALMRVAGPVITETVSGV